MTETLLLVNDYVLTCEKRVGVLLSLDPASSMVQIAYVDEAGEYDPDLDTATRLPRSAIMHIICNLDETIDGEDEKETTSC